MPKSDRFKFSIPVKIILQGDWEMRLFGKKKEQKLEESESTYEYEIFGGFTIIKKLGGDYEISWKSPNVTTIRVSSMPVISGDVQVKQEGDEIKVLTTECKLKVVMNKEGRTEAYISKI